MRHFCGTSGRSLRLLLVMALALVCGALYSAVPAGAANPSGLVAHYSFNANDASDSSGNGNSGTLVGSPSFVAGPSGWGNALALNGSGQYVSLPSPSTLSLVNHDFTVVAWVNAAAFSGLGGYGGDWPLLGNNTGGGSGGLHLVLRGGQPYMGFFGNDLGSSTSLSLNTWYQIAWQYQVSGGVMTMFVNGTQVASGGGHPAFVGGGTTFVGRCCEAWDAPRYAKGAIDDVQIYGRVLTPAEITAVTAPLAPVKPLQNLVITGGNGTPGTPDPSTDWSQDPVAWDAGISSTGAWHFTSNPSPVWHPAYLVGSHPWGLVPGTNSWINCGPTNASAQCGNAAGTVVAFRSRFTLPAGSENPSVKLWIDSDNAGTYYINGVQVTDRLVGGGGKGATQLPESAPGVPGVRTAALTSALHAGTNEMLVVVEDWGGLAGFNYKADITVNADAPIVIVPPTPVDSTPPAITPTVTGTLGSNGWYTSDVAVSWAVTDAESSITSQTGCSASSVTADTAGITFTCTATSGGGTATQSVTVERDATAPAITGSRTPLANAYGWNNGPVAVAFTCTDSGSGVGVNTVAGATVAADGAGQSVTSSGACVDNAGNAAVAKTVSGISIDTVAPTATGTRAPAANPNGWNDGAVSVSFACADNAGGSGIATDTLAGATLSADGAGQSVTSSGACVDKAGNAADAATVSGINVDTVAPVITGSRTPAANGLGWNNTPVTASFTCADNTGGSGLFIDTVAGGTLSADGAGQSVANGGTCVDLAGNTATTKTVSGISIDRTKPTLAPAVTPGVVALDGSATAAANAADALSGVLSASCTTPDTSAIGTFTVTCTATDKAGNEQTATASYTVTGLATKQAVLAGINGEAAGAARRDAENLREAGRKLADAVTASYWIDGNHLVVKSGKRVFDDEKEAVEKLQELLKDAKSGVARAKVQGWIAALVAVDKALAETAVDEATLSAKQAAAVDKELGKAAAALAKGKPAEAIEHFKHAWQVAKKGVGGDDRDDEDGNDGHHD